MNKRVITYVSETTILRLVEAGLGKATVAATPHGQLPALEVSEEVWKAYQDALSTTQDWASYLLERFR
jgi:hypothetical protein